MTDTLPNSGHSRPAGRNRPWAFIPYIAFAFLYWFSLYLYAPTLPTYIEGISGSLALVGVVLAQYGLWQALVRLPIGIAADWLGRRKPFILSGIILAGLGAWIMSSAEGIPGLALGRAITGLAAGTWVPLTVAFASLFPARDAMRATSILVFVQSIGRITGSAVTGSLNELGGYTLSFKLAAGVALLGLVAALASRERTKEVRRPSLGGLRILIMRRDVLLPALMAAVLQYIMWGISFGFLPILAEELGTADVGLSLLMSLHLVLLMVGSLISAAVVNRIGVQRLIPLAVVLTVVGTALAGLAPTMAVVFLAQALLGLGHGLNVPNLMGMSIRYVRDRERTTAMGLHQSVYSIGMFTGPWLSGLLANALGIRPMMGVTTIAVLFMALLITRQLFSGRGKVGGPGCTDLGPDS